MTSHMQLTTSDPDEMTSVVDVLLPTISVGTRKSGKFSADIDALGLSEVSLMRISTRNISVSSEPGGEHTTLTLPLRGGFEVDRTGHCDRYGGQDAHMHNLDRALDLASPDFSVLVVNVANSTLATTAAKLVGGERKRWIGSGRRISLTNGSGSRLWCVARSLWSSAQKEHRDSVSPPEITEQQGEVVEAMLQVMGVNQRPQPSQFGRSKCVTGLRRVEDWVAANLTDPITRADLCEVSGLSARTLTRIFASHYGIGPLQFVKDRRLEAVQRILLGSQPEETTVTQVAMDMGFSHLGRFSADYIAKVGETPSETLSK